MQGEIEGEPVARALRLERRTWYQPLSFALRALARGARQEEAFFCIRPETLELMELRAKRKGEEEVRVDGRTVRAVRVRIRLQGLLSVMLHGDYWFRTEGWVFVRYEGRNGPSGTPRTMIELVSEKPCWRACCRELGGEASGGSKAEKE